MWINTAYPSRLYDLVINLEDRKMKQNVGILDTAIRSIIACIVLALAVEGFFGLAVNIGLIVVGSAMWISATLGVCPLYKLLGIDTYPDFRDDSIHYS